MPGTSATAKSVIVATRSGAATSGVTWEPESLRGLASGRASLSAIVAVFVVESTPAARTGLTITRNGTDTAPAPSRTVPTG